MDKLEKLKEETMSKPIPATPTLRGKDAKTFLRNMKRVNEGKLTKQEKATAERINKLEKETKEQFVYMYDPKIKRRVVFVIKGNYAISLVSSHKVKLNLINNKIRKQALQDVSKDFRGVDIKLINTVDGSPRVLGWRNKIERIEAQKFENKVKLFLTLRPYAETKGEFAYRAEQLNMLLDIEQGLMLMKRIRKIVEKIRRDKVKKLKELEK